MKIVIFCGGFGTRMWPASRKSHPKQFYPLLGGKSFFQITVERFEKKYDPHDIIVSTEERYLHFIHEQAPQIPKENVIGEPERRDNLAAIALVTALMEKRFPKDVIFFSWADHLIKKEDEFLNYVQLASAYAQRTGRPVSVNEMPTFPSVHHGWLKLGTLTENIEGTHLYEIEKFIEKPNLQVAEHLFKSKGYLIHTGYGAWRVDTLASYFEKYAPETYKIVQSIAGSWGTDNYENTLKFKYGQIEKNSIDYGLFEKIPAHERLTLAVDTGWQDAGTWQLMYESLAKNDRDNLIEGGVKTSFFESDGNLVFGPKDKMIAVLGLSNIVVVDTPNGLLVCNLDKTSLVKDLFSHLEKDYPEFVE